MPMEDQKKYTLLVILALGIIIIGGGAYYFLHQSSAPQTPSYQSVATNVVSQQPTQVNNPTVSAAATLTQPSLISNSSTPTITGTFVNLNGGLEVLITKGNLPQNTLLSDSVTGVVWDDRSDHGGNVVLTDPTSGSFSNSVTTPLPDGTYSVGIYSVTLYYPETDTNLARDYRQLLTSGTLIVNSQP
jgi:hypothetical protein